MEFAIALLKLKPRAVARLMLGVGILDSLLTELTFDFGTEPVAVTPAQLGLGLVNSAALIRGETPIFASLDEEDFAWGLKDIFIVMMEQNGLVGLTELQWEPFLDSLGVGVLKRA